MLKASGDGKRRVVALFLFIGATLGFTALVGLAQRTLSPPAKSDPLPEKFLDEEALEERRILLKKIRALGKKRDWKGVVAIASEKCPDLDACSPLIRSSYLEAGIHLGKPGMVERFCAQARNTDSVAEADALAFLDKRSEYVKQVEAILAPVDPQNALPDLANNAAWAAVVMPGTPPQPEKVLALAERGVAQARPQARATFLNTLGVTLYRLRRDADAISTLTTTENLSSEPLNWPFLAMAHYRMGHTAEAKKWADRYHTFIDSTFGVPERSRIEPLLFLRELDATLPRKK